MSSKGSVKIKRGDVWSMNSERAVERDVVNSNKEVIDNDWSWLLNWERCWRRWRVWNDKGYEYSSAGRRRSNSNGTDSVDDRYSADCKVIL